MSEATGQIYGLIPKIMAEVGAIGKTRSNQQQGYKFRGVDDVYNAMQAPLAKYGVFFIPEVQERTCTERQTKSGGTLFYTILKMKFSFYAPDGSSLCATTIGEAMDSGDKSSNKAMSAALKYALLQVFCIPTDEPKDSENDTHDVKPSASPGPDEAFVITINELLASRNLDDAQIESVKASVCRKKKITSIKDLSVNDRAAFMKAIDEGKFDAKKGAA